MRPDSKVKNKYKPNDEISAVEINSTLSLFDRLAEINIAYGFKLDEDRQMFEVMI